MDNKEKKLPPEFTKALQAVVGFIDDANGKKEENNKKTDK